jgi:Rrf2 family transcriptional regulator, nitric oxide-sensitive transcriptional repressor
MHLYAHADIMQAECIFIGTIQRAMRLTRYTDYAMRVVIHLGSHDERLCSISEIARSYGIPQNNLMKVVQDLAQAGYVRSVRGRSGGVRLARGASEINLGELVRHTEAGFRLADCPNCPIAPACRLTGIFAEATGAFLSVLDRYSVADLLVSRSELRRILAPQSPEPCPPGSGLG